MIDDFHDILFPPHLGVSASKSIERQAEIQNFLSGREQRNARKYHSKRRYEVAVKAKSFDELARLTDFYEARRGALIGFRWHDILDYKSSEIGLEISAFDQKIGIFDATSLEFQLVKIYGEATNDEQNYIRKITKPKANTLLVAVDGVELNSSLFWVAPLTGLVTILPSAGLTLGDEITAGYEFDVAVRFAQMELKVDYTAVKAGEITNIPLLEILD